MIDFVADICSIRGDRDIDYDSLKAIHIFGAGATFTQAMQDMILAWQLFWTQAVTGGCGIYLGTYYTRSKEMDDFDVLAVPADTPPKADAMRLIHFPMQPDVIATTTNKVRYPNTIPAIKSPITLGILSNPSIYSLAAFFTIGAVLSDVARA